MLRSEAFDPDNFERWWQATDGKRAAIEYGINHGHLWDALPGTGENDDDREELQALCLAMAAAWRCGLREAFPEREFHVTIEESYGPSLYVVTSSTDDPELGLRQTTGVGASRVGVSDIAAWKVQVGHIRHRPRKFVLDDRFLTTCAFVVGFSIGRDDTVGRPSRTGWRTASPNTRTTPSRRWFWPKPACEHSGASGPRR